MNSQTTPEPSDRLAVNSGPAADATSEIKSGSAAASSAAVLNSQKIKEMLEISSKGLIGLAGLCYVLGLIVVTIHLRSYGLNSLALSQLNYVTAGVWVMIPVVVGGYFLMFAAYFVSQDEGQSKSNLSRILGKLWLLVVFGGMFFSAAESIIEPFGVHLTWRWFVIPILGVLASFCLVAAILMLASGEGSPYHAGFFVPAIFAGIGVFLFLFYVKLFAAHTYRDIPWATGGGRPSQVELVVGTEAIPYLESAGILFNSANRTNSVQLLLATEKEYVIIDPNGRAVGVPADSVKSLIYEK